MSEPELTLSTVIFTDGASSGNPGPGGWAAVVRSPKGDIHELGGFVDDTTNNRMELTGALRALASIAQVQGPVVLFTDSTYVIRGITQWIWGWKKRGWKTASGTAVTNQDLWQKLLSVTYARKPEVTWRYVPGHAGIPGNERCDRIAVDYSKGRFVNLFRGHEADYGVDLTLVPAPAPLPEMRKRDKKSKKKAHSYLSEVGGDVVRHDSWASCEARVKGRSGARFKKAMSAAEEPSILQAWGMSPSKLPPSTEG